MNENELARLGTKKFIGTVADTMIGEGVGESIAGPLLDLFGWSEEDKQEEYYKNIMKELKSIQNTLASVINDIDQLQKGVSSVRYDIKEFETHASIRDLRKANDSINHKFTTYVEALAGLSDKDENHNHEAALDLSGKAGILNPDGISMLMTDAQHAFCPTEAEDIGLLHLQNFVVRDAIKKAALPQKIEWTNSTIKWALGASANLDTPGGFWDCSVILKRGQEAGYAALESKVADTIKWFLITQLKGLVLITSGFKGSIHEGQVQCHMNELRRINRQIVQFMGSVAAQIDEEVASALYEHRKFLGPPMTTENRWTTWLTPPPKSTVQRHSDDLPLSNDFIMWEMVAKNKDMVLGSPRGQVRNYLHLIEKPWEYGDRCGGELENWHRGGSEMLLSVSPCNLSVKRYKRDLPPSLKAFQTLEVESSVDAIRVAIQLVEDAKAAKKKEVAAVKETERQSLEKLKQKIVASLEPNEERIHRPLLRAAYVELLEQSRTSLIERKKIFRILRLPKDQKVLTPLDQKAQEVLRLLNTHWDGVAFDTGRGVDDFALQEMAMEFLRMGNGSFRSAYQDLIVRVEAILGSDYPTEEALKAGANAQS